MTVRRIRHYFLSLLTIFVIVVCICASLSNRGKINSLYENIIDLNPGWDMVTPSATAHKGTIALERTFSVRELQSTNGGPTLFFRTNNTSVVIRVNGNYTYSYGMLGKSYVGNEYGSALHFFRLSHFFPNDNFTVNIEFSPAFEHYANKVFSSGTQMLITPKIYYGSKAACLQAYVSDCFIPAGVSIIILLLGISYLILTSSFWFLHRKYTRNFCYWGIFSLIVGAGFFMESGMADLFIPYSFIRYFASTLLLAILPDLFLMYIKTSKVLAYNTRLCNFFIVHSIVNAFIVCICAFIPGLPFSYVRNYIIICHAVYLFFVIAMFVNNSVGLSKLPSIPSMLVIITAVAILIDFTLYLMPPYRDDIFGVSRYFMLAYLITRTIEVINDYFSSQILSAREEMYRSVIVRDSLTGVRTRPAFWHFQKEFFKSNRTVNERLSLVLCEIVNLKSINEKSGYEEGDEALKTVSQILKLHFGQENVYRLDGSCFGVLLIDTPADSITLKIAEIDKIVDDYNMSQDLGTIRLNMTAKSYSIKQYESFDKFLLSCYTELGTSRKDLLQNL